MSRLGLALALLLVAALALFATMVRVTGPHSAGTSAPALSPRGDTASVADAPLATGPLVLPVDGVTPSALADSFDDPRDGGARRHHAIDIMAAEGAPVLAAAPGRIEKLFDSRAGGLTIYQRSPDGAVQFYYAHLQRYAPTLVEGQAVGAGEVIGSVGHSGDANSTAPHLHFEVHRMAPGAGWWQGEPVDPYPLLKGAR